MEISLSTAAANAAASPASANTEAILPTRMVVAQELKAARVKAGLSREQARKLLGHHDKQYFYRWERESGGNRTPDLASAVQLCIAYHCSLEELCPSLWGHYSGHIDSRRAKLAQDAKKPSYRRDVAHRTREWEVRAH